MADKDDDTPKGLDAARDAATQRQPENQDPPKAQEPADDDDDEYDEEVEDAKAENARLKAALKKANKDAERNRRRAKAAAGDDEDGSEGEKPEKEDRTAKLERELWTRDAIEELRDAGCQGDKRRLRRVVKMLDSVHPEEVADAIDDLKEDYPDLFKEEEEERPKRRRRATAPKAGPGGAETRRGGSRQGNLSNTSAALLRQAGIRN